METYEKCSVERALDCIGGKWKSVILYYLLDSTLRFNEIRRLLPGVTQRMLTLQLRELEKDGLIYRRVYPQIPPKVEYSLTARGQTLEPVLLALSEWGREHVAVMSVYAAPKIVAAPSTSMPSGSKSATS